MKLKIKHVLFLLLSAILLELAFAPFNQFYTAFFALLPFLYVLEKTKNGFLTGIIWGIFYCIISIHWLALNTGTFPWLAILSMLLASVFLALNYGVIGMLFKMIQRKYPIMAFLFLPFIWTGVEFLRSFGTFGFPWLSIGHSQAYNTIYAQIADIGGVYTITFLLLLTNLFLYFLIKAYSRRRLMALILILLFPFIYGAIMLNSDLNSGKELNFRIVQPNIPAKEKWIPSNRLPIINKLDSLSRIDNGFEPDVIVWPETAIPYYLRSSIYYTHLLNQCSKDMNSTLITGALDYYYKDENNWHMSTNTVFVFEPENYTFNPAVYDKLHLVAFGEFTPGGSLFSWLNNMEYGQSDFTHRNFREPLKMTADSIAFTPMVCYDSVFPHTVRSFANKGSQYNILITNDIWFGRSIGPHQHAAIAIIRAIETRRPLIRSANAGISLFIDEKGCIQERLPLYQCGILDCKLKAGDHISPYTKTGNLFGFSMTFIMIMGIVVSLWPKQKK
ncbi:MAG: apolipoprotein N-acyltransferase [Candidatus Marinimicrobia bacterium]|nr:apolipoprotein N-acyltransferase [Candidatus Neomarinimicrobiota bacterium]